jgi:hypothetical protein
VGERKSVNMKRTKDMKEKSGAAVAAHAHAGGPAAPGWESVGESH